MNTIRTVRTLIISLLSIGTLVLTGCTSAASEPQDADSANSVTLVVHDSFANDEFAAAASAATGVNVTVISAGDGGELSSQLVLTKTAPIADAFFGVDNVYANRLIENNVTEPFTPSVPLTPRAEKLAREVELADGYAMLPIDLGATCINIDPAWFAERSIAEPVTHEDLTKPEYAGLTVLLDPTSSSTGASFLIGTVAEFGADGFADYWKKLADNQPRLEQGWGDAYNGQFTQGGGGGSYPIVLSYSSSPAWTLNENGTASTTKALLDTCSTQVEYAGVLQGAKNPAGARAVVEYMLSREFQDTIAETMYMYPVDETAYLPDEWATFAPLPIAPNDLAPDEIAAGLNEWLVTWSEATGW